MVFAWDESKDRLNRQNMVFRLKKKSVSSPQEKRIAANALFTTPLTDGQRRSLRKLAAKPDSEIDYSDAPESDPSPSEVHTGRFYRPIKQLVSIRVDARRPRVGSRSRQAEPDLQERSAPPRDADSPRRAIEKATEAGYSRPMRSVQGRIFHVRLIVPRHPAVPHLQTTRSTSLSNR